MSGTAYKRERRRMERLTDGQMQQRAEQSWKDCERKDYGAWKRRRRAPTARKEAP